MQSIINVPESFNWHRNRIYAQRVIGTYLEPGMRFLDIGSNMGYFSYFAANVMAGNGEVHAFEPIQNLTESIRSKVDRSARENEPKDILIRSGVDVLRSNSGLI